MLLPRWFTDPAEAAQHATRAAATAGVLAAICWFPLAYFVVGPHSVVGAAIFAVLMGSACCFGTMRGVRSYKADPSRAGRLRAARRGGLRIGVMFAVLLVVAAVAIAVQSLAVLAVGVLAAIVAPMLLRLFRR